MLALVGLAVLGLALRLYALNWDQGNNFHPDERQILFVVMALSWPGSVAQFFDPLHSPLNPHFFAYGSFPLYLLAGLGAILAHFWPDLAPLPGLTLVGRTLSALFDSGTILLTGWLGLLLVESKTAGRNQAWVVAWLAAALVTFTPFQLQLSHFYAVDTQLLFFVTLTVLACVALVKTSAPIRWSLVAGLAYGLAMATKFSAAPLIIPLLAAVAMRWYKYGASSGLTTLLLAACTSWLMFLIAMPYALLDLPDFVAQVNQQSDLARGILDLPYVRQFAGTTPYVYELQNMFLWGLGVLLGAAALCGMLWILWRIWRRNAGLWMVVVSWVLVYAAVTGSFYVKFMRYMLPIYPFLTLMAAAFLVACVRRLRARQGSSYTGYARRILAALPYLAILLVVAGTMFQGLALLNVYSRPNTRVQASQWIYSHIKPGSVLTYEQWDDALPVQVGSNLPSIYTQATYPGANGQAQTGLDLYGDDTTAKAQQLSSLLPTIDAITMATDRLDKSIPRLPLRYPLTIHYYQLLFSGQLGFHLAARFENHPNLFGITLDDSNADESYSVFDHPTVKIFVRDNPYPYTSAQLLQKLLAGVQLPPPAGLAGAQRSLLLTPRQIAADQSSPAFASQFPAQSITNSQPVLFWWLTLFVLGLLVYPVVGLALRGLRDRGYIFSKLLGILLLAYFAWLLASLHLLAFSCLSLFLVIGGLLICSLGLFAWQRRAFSTFLRQHWRLLLLEEGIFTLTFLLFVGIRALNPDLWHIYRGGEKPMELAFLNAVLRSPYMPPYDPWFAGGYINYYYYSYVIWGALIKLTAIVPTTAFNLIIPTLFALTFSGAVSLVYSLTRRFSIALLAGYFVACIGNLDGLVQLRGQLMATLSHLPVPAFDYWQSSRVIPFTINEFPFWSFLFADLHPHVMDLPITVLMLGVAAALLLSALEEVADGGLARILLYLCAAFVFGTLACVNPWDMPTSALVLAAVLLLRTFQQKRESGLRDKFAAAGFCLLTIVLLCGLGYLLYLPFYSSYQQLFINGLGSVGQGTSWGDFLTVFGLWIFLALSFLLLELYRWWATRGKTAIEARRSAACFLLCGVALTFMALLGLKALLFTLIGLAVFLFVLWSRMAGGVLYKAPAAGSDLTPAVKTGRAVPAFDATAQFTYLLLVLGLCILLGQELVYVRDFLDGGAYYRMNTVFKFSIQAWVCLGIGGALAVQRLWHGLRGIVRRVWVACLLVLVIACSIFLPAGTASRIGDHLGWAKLYGPPPVQSASYTPTLDGFAFARAWYPADAQAITWLNEHVSGSPVILEAAASDASYQWYNRVSVYTGLPDVIGWPDHVSEQRYAGQADGRVSDVATIYTTPDAGLALSLLRSYHVRYIYVGPLEQQVYGRQVTERFTVLLGRYVRETYHSAGVTIYEMA